MNAPPPSDLVRVRRHPGRGKYERAAIVAALDAGLVAHVAFSEEGRPFCVPMLYARVRDSVYVHGASSSRVMRRLGEGVPACVTVTALHGLVFARSAFEHSANYESVMVLGSFAAVPPRERAAALDAFTDRLAPGRSREVRPPTEKELAATSVLALPIDAASVKVRSGPPDDDSSADAELDVWAGVLPVRTGYGTPEPSPGLRRAIPVPRSVQELLDGSRTGR